jgi:hypothetical protein
MNNENEKSDGRTRTDLFNGINSILQYSIIIKRMLITAKEGGNYVQNFSE